MPAQGIPVAQGLPAALAPACPAAPPAAAGAGGSAAGRRDQKWPGGRAPPPCPLALHWLQQIAARRWRRRRCWRGWKAWGAPPRPACSGAAESCALAGACSPAGRSSRRPSAPAGPLHRKYVGMHIKQRRRIRHELMGAAGGSGRRRQRRRAAGGLSLMPRHCTLTSGDCVLTECGLYFRRQAQLAEPLHHFGARPGLHRLAGGLHGADQSR